MSLFTRNAYGTNNSFHPLFRLLDDYDTYAHQSQNSRNNRSIATSFHPKFDVREVEDAYELYGELPGISKEDVHIDFSDPHTLHIRGRIERSYSPSTQSTGLIHGALARGDATEPNKTAGSPPQPHDHRVTVEDENSAESTAKAVVSEKKADIQPTDGAMYWVYERSIGEFSRTFNFPGQVQQDAVTAGLKDGVLTVRVPKAPKNEGRRRIMIN